MYSLPKATATNYYQLGSLKQQKYILSCFLELEVCYYGVGRLDSS